MNAHTYIHIYVHIHTCSIFLICLAIKKNSTKPKILSELVHKWFTHVTFFSHLVLYGKDPASNTFPWEAIVQELGKKSNVLIPLIFHLGLFFNHSRRIYTNNLSVNLLQSPLKSLFL